MSQKQKQQKPLNQFELVPVHGCRRAVRSSRRPEHCDCCPVPRSGHRIFADADFVYIIGGYNPMHSPDSTYTDIWRFNRLTQLWQQCSVPADSLLPQLPNTLASFSLVDCPNISNEQRSGIYLFGGTGVPFGVAASDQIHRIQIDFRGNARIQREEIKSQPMGQNGQIGQTQQVPPKMYGHAMCQRIEMDNDGKLVEVLYLAGGTSGHIYNMDVWRLERQFGRTIAPWKCTQLNNGFEVVGRYRLEMVIHEHMLWTFGGGAPEFCAEFDEILAFNLRTKRFETIKTHPDPEFGIPQGRKCHALVQQGNLVYMIGGCRDAEIHNLSRHHQITNDVWQFNLNNAQWLRMRTNLPKPVFFHSATLTSDGCLFVFGGCTDESAQTRCNRLQRMWLQPPSLKCLASASLINALPESIRQQINREGIRMSDTKALITLIFAPSLAA